LSQNKYELIIMNEGIYEVKLGVYGDIFPKIEICLNNETII